MLYGKIKQRVSEMLPVKKEIKENDNLLNAGLDSLKIMRMVNELRKEGIRISYGKLLENPTLSAWESMIKSAKVIKNKVTKQRQKAANPVFPLTDVQYAYKIGREDDSELGGVGCHAFMEFAGKGIDAERLNNAWKKVQYHHPMLRARFDENGQEIMEKPYNENIDIYDFSNDDEYAAKTEELKRSISHRKFEIEKGHVCAITLVFLPEDKYKIFYDIDLLVADVQSFNIILRDIAAAYIGKELPNESANWSFADYLTRKARQEKDEEFKACEYWKGRIESMPLGPELPLAKSPGEIKETRTKRYIVNVPAGTWDVIKKKSAAAGVTQAVYLMAVYASVIGSRSTSKKFLLNLPLFNRHSEYGAVEDAVADFTTLLLLEVDLTSAVTFEELVKQISGRLHKDLEHTAYSGVRVQRDIMKKYGETKTVAPVVFACNFGNSQINDDVSRVFGEFRSMLSQTPGVWIDFQSYESEDGVMLTWDCVVGLFPDGLIEAMLESLEELINDTAQHDWNRRFCMLPESQRVFIQEQKEINTKVETGRLFDDFMKRATEAPEKIAVRDTDTNEELSYKELKDRSLSVAGFFIDKGIKGETIAVTLKRGHRQLTAVLGILMSGNSYVPVSDIQPKSRREIIHKRMGVRYAVSEKRVMPHIEWPQETSVLDADLLCEHTPADVPVDVRPEDTAYIIMTSGTTGEPKGVEISHKGAVNTIRDVNSRYKITSSSKLLGISAMDFDLSVYDFFGITGAGGTLITIPDDKTRDAEFWLEQIRKYRINVWNSVPVLMEMLLVEAKSSGTVLPLKTVMLSGDWIGLDLPQKITELTKDCEMYSMGGATECSIWSNCFKMEVPVPDKWHSIPYGRPLSGQSYRVVNDDGLDVPFLCEGELLIGGAGVGSYRGDEKLLSEKFFEENGVRWYKTGDKGRFRNDGTIEFLGRKDFQVKVRGHRIELGEIEAALKEICGVKGAAVEVSDGIKGDKHLVAYIETEGIKEAPLFTEDKETASLLNELKKVIRERAVIPSEAAGYDEFVQNAAEKEAEMLFDFFAEKGLFTDGKSVSFQEICERCEISESYKLLVRRFLNLTESCGLITLSDDGHYKKGTICKERKNVSYNMEDIEGYLCEVKKHLSSILKGDKKAEDVYFLPELNLEPSALFNMLPASKEFIEVLVGKIKKLAVGYGRTITIADVESRNTEYIKFLAETLKSTNIKLVCIDSSAFFTSRLKDRLSEYDFIETRIHDFEKNHDAIEEYDMIISFNYLHRCEDKLKVLRSIKKALTNTGILCIGETVEISPLQDISAGMIEKGREVLPDIAAYEKYLKEACFGESTELFERSAAAKNGLFALASDSARIPDKNYLTEILSEKLPEYMIPKVFNVLDAIPLSGNGKVDRKVLKRMASNTHEDIIKKEAVTDIQKQLCSLWEEVFAVKDIGITDNYYHLGGDSLIAVKMSAKIKNIFNIRYTVNDAMKDVTIEQQAKTIENYICTDKGTTVNEDITVSADPESANIPFPLTEVQNAYFMGRSGDFILGNVSTHCYFELDGSSVDADRADKALNEMIKKHGAMRLVMTKDGMQRILKSTPAYRMERYDFRELTDDLLKKELEAVRSDMSHQVIDIFNWPLFDIRIADFKEKSRIFVSFDNIVFDGFSMFAILSEWAEAYRGEHKEEPDSDFTFRDYVLGLEKIKSSGKYEEDKKYWLSKLEDFPMAPALPLKKSESEISNQSFERHSAILERHLWESLKKTASENGVTPTALLITAYAEVLRTRSADPRFAINLTQFDKKQINSGVNSLLGDFTTLTLLEAETKGTSTFLERIKKLAEIMGEALEHSCYSAVDFERELRHKTQNMTGSIMPVVFTSGLGISKWDESKWLGRLTYNVSQTPQVWLDHQVVETDRGLGLFWDSLKDIFYPGFIDEMFRDYIHLIERLAQDKELFFKKAESLINVRLSKDRLEANETDRYFSDTTLERGVLEACTKYPERIAIVQGDRRISYAGLREKILKVCALLRKNGIRREETVAIYAEKGPDQIIAAIGILLAGGAYIPLDINNPSDRLQKILDDSLTAKVIAGEDTEIPEFLQRFDVMNISESDSLKADEDDVIHKSGDSLAYVIYTSGSTGVPKGVMISHSGAVNTIEDINERFGVNQNDACMAISNMHFDLSVYDMFGLLSVGGKVVIPENGKEKEPKHWKDLLNNEGITIWNSVPAFAEMLCEYNAVAGDIRRDKLRLMLLSGDWISTQLPGKIKEQFDDVRFTALGGATEASIWSNIYEVTGDIPESCNSIPYGKPLKNQRYYIFDENLNHRPDWVPGTIYIAGKGVALGYLNDAIKTKKSFIKHPVTGEYMYNTGDMGKYLSDGNIEFLGRIDNQIKINGYRVEIGEIESALNNIEGVSEGKVIFKGGSLVAFYKYDNEETRESEFVKDNLESKLPKYMIPKKIIPLEEYPLTSNGKIDYTGMFNMALEYKEEDKKDYMCRPDTVIEKELTVIWGRVLQYEDIFTDDDFFAKGGDSLKAIRLVNAVKQEMNTEIDVKDLFGGGSLAKIAGIISDKQKPGRKAVGMEKVDEFEI